MTPLAFSWQVLSPCLCRIQANVNVSVVEEGHGMRWRSNPVFETSYALDKYRPQPRLVLSIPCNIVDCLITGQGRVIDLTRSMHHQCPGEPRSILGILGAVGD